VSGSRNISMQPSGRVLLWNVFVEVTLHRSQVQKTVLIKLLNGSETVSQWQMERTGTYPKRVVPCVSAVRSRPSGTRPHESRCGAILGR
jgi:hypothetical protein